MVLFRHIDRKTHSISTEQGATNNDSFSLGSKARLPLVNLGSMASYQICRHCYIASSGIEMIELPRFLCGSQYWLPAAYICGTSRRTFHLLLQNTLFMLLAFFNI